MRLAFIREFQAYKQALEGMPYSFDDFIEGQARTMAVSAQFAADKAEQVRLFDASKTQLAEIYLADPDADFKSRDLTERLGLPNTQGMRSRISRQIKLLRAAPHTQHAQPVHHQQTTADAMTTGD